MSTADQSLVREEKKKQKTMVTEKERTRIKPRKAKRQNIASRHEKASKQNKTKQNKLKQTFYPALSQSESQSEGK